MKKHNNISLARNLRRNMTEPERRLWRALRQIPLQNSHFRRQVPIENYIIDFAYLPKKLLIEIDGESHFSDITQQKDALRDAHLKSLGFQILRFTNLEVMQNLEGVVLRIMQMVEN